MKKKLVTIVLSAVMVLALAACESNDTSAESTSAQITSEPIAVASTQRDEAAATPTTTASPTTKPEVTEAPTETPVATEAPTESPDPTQAPTETPDVTEAPTEQPQATEPTEQQQPTEQQPAEQQQPTEQPAEQQQPTGGGSFSDSTVNACIVNGLFDINEYAYQIGAETLYAQNSDFCMVFDRTWFIQAGSDADHPGMGFITIGRWEVDNPAQWNIATYSYIFDFGDGIGTVEGMTLPREVLNRLPSVVSAMKANPNPDVAPSVSGATFKPCEYNDAFIQH
jgi:hypothetical protein